MSRFLVVAFTSPGAIELSGVIPELEQYFEVTSISTAGGRLPKRSPSARCVIVLGEKPEWLEGEFSRGSLPPIVWVPSVAEAHPGEAVGPIAFSVSPFERERLPRVVAACVIADLLERIRRALVASPALSGREKLRKVLASYLGTEPPSTLQGAAKRVGRGAEWLRQSWVDLVRTSHRPIERLTTIVHAFRFLRAAQASLMDETGRAIAGSEAVGVRPSTLRGDFADFVGSLPSKTELDGLLSRRVADRNRDPAVVLAGPDGAEPAGKELKTR